MKERGVHGLHFSFFAVESCLSSSLSGTLERTNALVLPLSLRPARPLCRTQAPEKKERKRMAPLLGGGRPLLVAPMQPSMMPSTSSASSASSALPRAPAPRRGRPVAPRASGGMSYKDAGVDIDAGNELVRRIQKLNPSIGGFSGMVPFGEKKS